MRFLVTLLLGMTLRVDVGIDPYNPPSHSLPLVRGGVTAGDGGDCENKEIPRHFVPRNDKTGNYLSP